MVTGRRLSCGWMAARRKAVAPTVPAQRLVRQPEIEIFTVVSLFFAGSGWFWLGAGGVVARSASAGGVRGC